MKLILPLLTASGVMLLAATTANAQYAPFGYQYQPYTRGQFYLEGGLGGTVMQDLHVKNGGSSMTFDPGMRGDVTVGFQILDPIALEFESGVIWNSLNNVNGLNLSAAGQNADLYQIPLLANVVYRVPLRGGFSAYVGVGAGGIASELDLSQHQPSGFWHHSSDTDYTFAYQGKAGLKCALNPGMEIGLGYKFLGTLDHSWFDHDAVDFTRTGPSYSHSIMASFTVRF